MPVLLLMVFFITMASSGQADDMEFKTFRWDEDYSYLQSKSQLRPYERLKYNAIKIAGQPGYASFGGSIRSRINIFDNDRFGLQGGQDGELWLNRIYLHSDLHIGSQFRAFVELSSHLADASGDLQPGPFDKDVVAISQMFVDWPVGNSRLRLGRQEMGLGSARVMGTRDGSNVRRSYDGLRWDKLYGSKEWRAFYLRLVDIETGKFDNNSDGNETLWGLNSTSPLGKGKADIYYLGLKRQNAFYAQGADDETRHSVGVRLFGNSSDWDWNLEALYQFGEFGDADISAWTVASIIGYRISSMRWTPRLALSTNIAGGDEDPSDNRLETFNPLFPNLAYFEEAAIYAPQNFYNIEPEITLSLTKRLEISLDWNFFWRLETEDAVYVRGLNPLPGTAGSSGHFVAHTPSVSVDYQYNRHLSVDLSYSHFFARGVIKNAGGEDVDFFKLQWEWKF